MGEELDNEIMLMIDQLRRDRPFGMMERYRRLGYQLEIELELVEAIGKFRSPRFAIDDDNRFVYTNFIRWCNGDPAMQTLDPQTMQIKAGNLKSGIFLAGPTGTGKSWCLDIMREYIRFREFEIGFPKDRWNRQIERRALAWTVERADDISRKFATDGSIDNFKRQRVLGIQDLGQEPLEMIYMGNRQNVLAQLLEYRGDQGDQLTLITSNLFINDPKFRERYGERLQSRLFEICNFLPLKGKDRRR